VAHRLVGFESCALIQIVKSSGKVKLAADDVRGAIELWPLWVRLGWNDILYRYRRSTLGPFWFTASMAITIVALGSVYSQVLRLPARELMPHVCVGLIVWAFMNSTVLEAGDLFTGSESYIKHVKLPYSLYVFRFVLSKTIIFAHDFPIYLATIAYFGIWPGPVAFYAIPGFLLLVINGVLITISLGMASARFRDIPRIIASLSQIVFLITPIIWVPGLLGERSYLAEANPFFHLIELIRAPLLGSAPSKHTLIAAVAITFTNLLVAGVLFTRYRNRIAYWI
jgi:ABC-2 type transport system permease protein/lipopolysaccharide transport system permease protein